jgi:hypothetical protein
MLPIRSQKVKTTCAFQPHDFDVRLLAVNSTGRPCCRIDVVRREKVLG